jgi:hypothetical protein
MAPETVPEDLRRFILTSIASVPSLEALLLLREDAQHDWKIQEVARRLYLTEGAARDLLNGLCEAGMAVACEADAFRFMPSTEELRELIDRLAAAYARDLIGVSNMIHSRMGKSAQVFADAFKLRKEP